MFTIDLMLKETVVRTATSFPKATVSAIIDRQESRHDYLLRFFNAPITTQIAVRDAAAEDEAHSQLARILTVLLSPPLDFTSSNPNGDGPTIRPPSAAVWNGALGLSFGAAPTGKVLRYEIGNDSVEATPDVSSSSTVWDYTSSFLLFSASSHSPLIVKARYFIGSDPASDQSLTAYRIDLDALAQSNKAQVIAAFTRRSQNAIGALKFINDKHIWSGHEEV